MIIYGGVTTNNKVAGQNINLELSFRYPNTNAATYEGETQDLTPPIELSEVEFRVTDNEYCLVNPDHSSVSWTYFSKGTLTIPTADYISGAWVGRTDKIQIPTLPVRYRRYFQGRCKGLNGVWSDWSPIKTIQDKPTAIATPVITSILTNDKDQVRLVWTDVAALISNFSHYEIVRTEVSVQARLDTNAVIVK